jgi:hypothetical protein
VRPPSSFGLFGKGGVPRSSSPSASSARAIASATPGPTSSRLQFERWPEESQTRTLPRRLLLPNSVAIFGSRAGPPCYRCRAFLASSARKKARKVVLGPMWPCRAFFGLGLGRASHLVIYITLNRS